MCVSPHEIGYPRSLSKRKTCVHHTTTATVATASAAAAAAAEAVVEPQTASVTRNRDHVEVFRTTRAKAAAVAAAES